MVAQLLTVNGEDAGRRVHFPSLNHIAILFIIFGIALPLDIVFIRSSRLIFGGVPGAYLTFFQQLIVVVVSILPAMFPKLNPGGILGFRLRTAEKLWTKPLTGRNASIYKALQSVFPEALFIPRTTNIVTASLSPLPRTPEVMSRWLQDRKIATRLISPNYIRYIFTNDRFFKIRDLLKSEKALPNTDIRPVCYQYAFIIWLSKFFPRIAAIDPSLIMDKIFLKPPLSLLL